MNIRRTPAPMAGLTRLGRALLSAVIVAGALLGAAAPAHADMDPVARGIAAKALNSAFGGQVTSTYSLSAGITTALNNLISVSSGGNAYGWRLTGTINPASAATSPVAVLFRTDLTVTGDLSRVTGSSDFLSSNCVSTFTNITAGPVTTMGGCQSGLYVGTGNTGITFNGLRAHVLHMENNSVDTITLLKGVEPILTYNAGVISNFRVYDCPTVTSGVAGGGSVTNAWCLYNADASAKIESAGLIRGAGFDVTSTSCSGVVNGLCLSATNQLALMSSSGTRFNVNSSGLSATAGSGARIVSNSNAAATTPVVIPNQTDTKAGIGADAAGDVSIIANNGGTATEKLRVTGAQVLLLAVPTADPHVVGAVWNNSGVLTLSAG